MPSIWEVIRKEHVETTALFDRFAEAPESRRAGVAEEIRAALAAHTSLEEELVYPALRAMDVTMAANGRREHDEARQALRELAGQEVGGELFMRTMEQLQACVLEHIRDEEDDVLPMMEGAMEDDEARRLAEEWALRRKEILAGAR